MKILNYFLNIFPINFVVNSKFSFEKTNTIPATNNDRISLITTDKKMLLISINVNSHKAMPIEILRVIGNKNTFKNCKYD